jgi:hypothetical protein
VSRQARETRLDASSKPGESTRARQQSGDHAALRALLDLQRVSGNAAVEALLRPLSGRRGGDRGRPLPQPARDRLEAALGADLGSVRVVTDADVATTAGALAVTAGTTISFASGEFAPDEPRGFRLLAHEAAHVVQQERAARVDPAAPQDAGEAEAWSAADAAISGGSAAVGAGQVVPPAQAADAVPLSPLAPRPYVIEMDWQGGEGTSELGYERDAPGFWKRYREKWPEHLSAKNKGLIDQGLSPKVDEQWIKYYPQDEGFMGETLEHHHEGQGSRAVAMPEKLHDAYTAVHPREKEVGTREKPPKPGDPLPPRPTHAGEAKEIARHTEEGRMGTKFPPGKPPPAAPEVPAGSEVISVPPAERRPIDPAGQKVIGGVTYPAERAAGETRYPPAKYTPSEGATTGKPTALPAPDPASEQVVLDWGKSSPLADKLKSAPAKGGEIVQLGKLEETQPPAKKPLAPAAAEAVAQTAEPAQTPKPTASKSAEAVVESTETAPSSKLTASKTAPTTIAPVEAEALEAGAAKAPRVRPTGGMTSGAIEEIQVGRARNVGAAVGAVGGLLVGWGLGKYKEWMEESLAAAPPVEVDDRPLRDYLQKTSDSMSILDLMSKDIAGFGASLQDEADAMLGRASAATVLTRLAGLSPADRIATLQEIQSGVGAFEGELATARRGVEAALELEAAAEERAETAHSLAEIFLSHQPGVTNAFVWDKLVEIGFGIDEIIAMSENLRAYASRVRRLFRELHELQDEADRVFERVATFNSALNKLYWSEIAGLARSAH